MFLIFNDTIGYRVGDSTENNRNYLVKSSYDFLFVLIPLFKFIHFEIVQDFTISYNFFQKLYKEHLF